MKTKLIAILLIFTFVFFTACSDDDDDSVTEAPDITTNTLTLSGEINATFETIAIAGTSNDDSTATFDVIITPAEGVDAPEGFLSFGNNTGEVPGVGTYPVTEEVLGQPGYYAAYWGTTGIYNMVSGEIVITESSSTKLSGTYDMTGYLFDFTGADSTKTLTAKGSFTALMY